MDTVRLVLGLLAGAVVATVVSFAFGVGSAVWLHRSLGLALDNGLFTAMVAWPFIFAFAFGAGFPVYRLILRQRKPSLTLCGAAGLVIAFIAVCILLVCHWWTSVFDNVELRLVSAIAFTSGACAGVTVWFVVQGRKAIQ